MSDWNKINADSGKDDWRTPRALFDRLHAQYHFTLDAAANDENHLCKKYYTAETDGLQQDWSGETVYLNPPYSGKTGTWIAKAYQESLKGAVVVCLIPARPDAAYWHDYILPHASEVRFIRGRLRFSDGKQSAPFPSAIVVFGGGKVGIHGD